MAVYSVSKVSSTVQGTQYAAHPTSGEIRLVEAVTGWDGTGTATVVHSQSLRPAPEGTTPTTQTPEPALTRSAAATADGRSWATPPSPSLNGLYLFQGQYQDKFSRYVPCRPRAALVCATPDDDTSGGSNIAVKCSVVSSGAGAQGTTTLLRFAGGPLPPLQLRGRRPTRAGWWWQLGTHTRDQAIGLGMPVLAREWGWCAEVATRPPRRRRPAVLDLAGGGPTPVSSTTDVVWESTARIGPTQALPWESRSALAAFLALPAEWRGGVGQAPALAWESRGATAVALPVPWESRGATALAFAVAWESAGRLSAPLAPAVEWTARAALALGLPAEWVARAAASLLVPWESQGPAQVSLAVAIPYESRGRASQSVAAPWESGARVLLALAVPAEWRAIVAPALGLPAEWRGRLALTLPVPQEWAARLAAPVLVPVEWRGIVSLASAIPWESGTAAVLLRSLGGLGLSGPRFSGLVRSAARSLGLAASLARLLGRASSGPRETGREESGPRYTGDR